MSDLASRRCEPCRSGATPLAGAEIGDLVAQIDPAWQVVDGHHLRREFRFKDFAQALAFTTASGSSPRAPINMICAKPRRLETWTQGGGLLRPTHFRSEVTGSTQLLIAAGIG
jgi:hypothetical protein